MINLLSDVKKADIRAARNNTILLRYIAVLFGALLFIGGAIFVSHQALKVSEASADAQLALPSAPSEENTQPSTLATDMSAINRELQTQKTSSLLTALAQALPEDVIMNELSLSNSQINGSEQINLTLYAKDDGAAGTIDQQLNASGLFSDATVAASEPSAEVPGYTAKIQLTLRVGSGVSTPEMPPRSPRP